MFERARIGLLAFFAGAVGASVVVGFTAFGPVDRCWTALFAVVLVVAASRATITPILFLAAAAVGATIGSLWLIAAGAALALGFIALRVTKAAPWHQALVASLAITALVHPAEEASTLLVAVLVIIGAVPVMISGFRHGTGVTGRRIKVAALISGVFVGVSVLTAVVLGVLATPSLRNAVSSSRAGVAATKAGDLESAAGSFDAADAGFLAASGFIDSVLMAPAKLLPVIGINLKTAREVISAGHALASTAHSTVSSAPYDTLHLAEDGIDLDKVAAMQEPVATLSTEVTSVQQTLDTIDHTWLLPPVNARVADFTAQMDAVGPEIETASMALDRLPDMLGATTPRSYLVEFTSESESRFLGGFVGSYSVLTADHGRLSLAQSESVGTLNRKLGPDSNYEAPIEFRNLYDRFHPQAFAQNWTVSPDLPSDVSMVAQLFAQATGVRIDGVIVVDPFGLASLLKLTGPIRVDGISVTLTSQNAAEYLLHGQYLEFAGQRDERRDHLADVGKRAFDQLLRSSKTTYREVGRALGPAVTDGNIRFSALDPGAQSLLDRLGMTGRFQLPSNAATFSFRTSASFANKIDFFLHRRISMDSEINPSTNEISSDVTIELRNDAPSSGLPDYIIGNDNGEPTGTNGTYFSIYTSLQLSDARLEGQPVALDELPDRGMLVFSKGITIPPGTTRTLHFKLRGIVPPSSTGYLFQLPHQPTANDDQIRFSIRSSDPHFTVTTLTGLGDETLLSENGDATAESTVTSNRLLGITIRRN